MDDLRTEIGKAIVGAFEADYKRLGPDDADYNPDTCYVAADKVIALLVSKLLDVDVEAIHHASIIGPARFVMSNADGKVTAPVSDNLL